MRNVIVAVLIFRRRRAIAPLVMSVLQRTIQCKANVLRFVAQMPSKCILLSGTNSPRHRIAAKRSDSSFPWRASPKTTRPYISVWLRQIYSTPASSASALEYRPRHNRHPSQSRYLAGPLPIISSTRLASSRLLPQPLSGAFAFKRKKMQQEDDWTEDRSIIGKSLLLSTVSCRQPA